MSASFSPQIGERFASRYELRSPLRSDGAVRAFLAFDHHAGLDVALLLFEPACAHPTTWGAFARVVASAAAGKIAGLLLPQGISSTPTVPPFCLAEPQALRGFDRLRDQGPMPWQRALTLGERAAEILNAAHAATGIAHRVLTPSRCAVTVRDDVRVLDFGVAELELGRLEEAGYRAPEQQQGGGDARSDVYTLAVILFELISGQCLAGKSPPRLRSLVAVPRPVDELMAKALSQDPAQRLDLLAMRAALRELLGVAAVPAEPTPAAVLSPGSNPEISPAPIISASPPRPSAPDPVTMTVPLPPRPEDIPRRVFPTIAPPGFAASPARPSPTRPPLLTPASATPAVKPPSTWFVSATPSASPTALASSVLERTEVLPPAPRPAAVLADTTEVLPPAPRPVPGDEDRTEVIRTFAMPLSPPEKTEQALRGPFTSRPPAPRMARPATVPVKVDPLLIADPPTERVVRPPLPPGTTFLTSSDRTNAGDIDTTGSPVTSEETTTVFTNSTPPMKPAPGAGPANQTHKVLIWINIICFAAVVVGVFWMLFT